MVTLGSQTVLVALFMLPWAFHAEPARSAMFQIECKGNYTHIGEEQYANPQATLSLQAQVQSGSVIQGLSASLESRGVGAYRAFRAPQVTVFTRTEYMNAEIQGAGLSPSEIQELKDEDIRFRAELMPHLGRAPNEAYRSFILIFGADPSSVPAPWMRPLTSGASSTGSGRGLDLVWGYLPVDFDQSHRFRMHLAVGFKSDDSSSPYLLECERK